MGVLWYRLEQHSEFWWTAKQDRELLTGDPQANALVPVPATDRQFDP